MEVEKRKTIYTIGHSTRSIEDLINMLLSFQIEILADVRHYPGSKRYPHFNKDALQQSLPEAGIQYIHMKDLGGRRTASKDSINTRWKHAAFRGYADYMQTESFINAAKELENSASKNKLAYMCSEAVWWSCHRALISDWLKVRGWEVQHIMSEAKLQEHPFTKAARVVDNQLRYDEPELF